MNIFTMKTIEVVMGSMAVFGMVMFMLLMAGLMVGLLWSSLRDMRREADMEQRKKRLYAAMLESVERDGRLCETGQVDSRGRRT